MNEDIFIINLMPKAFLGKVMVILKNKNFGRI